MELFDAHIHIGREGGKPITAPYEETILRLLGAYAALGITALRDGGDARSLGLTAKKLAADLGIRFITPIRALVRRGGYGVFLGAEVSGIPEIRSELHKLRRQGADFIKVIQSGIVSFDNYGEISDGGFSAGELRYIIDCAHGEGLRVMVHANREAAVGLSLDKGADSIEHGYFMGAEQIKAMANLGVVWTPTFAPLRNYLRTGAPSQGQCEVINRTLALHREDLRLALDCGVPLALGSDAGAFAVPHGRGLLDEIDCFAEAGISGESAEQYMREIRDKLFS